MVENLDDGTFAFVLDNYNGFLIFIDLGVLLNITALMPKLYNSYTLVSPVGSTCIP